MHIGVGGFQRAHQELYFDELANPKIEDDLQRLCRRGSTKVPAYLLPSIVDAKRAGRPTSS